MYVGDMLNKIRWDPHIKLEEITIVYFDRVAEKTFEIALTVMNRRGNFFSYKTAGREEFIPIHRIRQIKRNGKVIWEQT